MDFDFNTAIQNGIEKALLAHVQPIYTRLNNIEASMRLKDARHEELFNKVTALGNQVETCRREIALLANSSNALHQRVNELAADLGRWKGKQLEIPHSTMQNIYQTIEEGLSNCAGADGFAELQREVEALRRQVEALDHAKAKDDERFEEDVKSVLDKDNDDARIREIVKDVLEDDDFLAERLADVFNKGAMTISVDKV